eukprot:CAMPEP_0202858882 /NCGR_PEP_ID=MMETSP1391-20130828/1227_1 /ASSEMBLY_ACC=CAM_ASM_000867 /TAXON_ID=1034604 /ORGANISM="Chlamydomonas leiostraca, Strain SAG 11-49" /LENGTH=549 /DNA_ID=CAMNT_0049537853 /DNA_START=179 /DNA_END=1828 /DNA_ORIENTATION=+
MAHQTAGTRAEHHVCKVAIDYNKIAIGQDMPKDYSNDIPNWAARRRAGVIIHPTSLPGPYGIGELGEHARNLVDWMGSAGLQVWQILPLVPPDPMFYSPYSGTDSNAGNPLVISIDELIKMGLLDASDAPKAVQVADVDFPAVAEVKMPLLCKAADRLLADDKFKAMRDDLNKWRRAHSWIEDSALFEVARNLPSLCDKAWWEWPEALRFRRAGELRQFKEANKVAIEQWVAIQFLFDTQWKAIRDYANARGVKIIGDMPIYVGGHSADVWANQRLFDLGPSGKPANVSGVPPDAFSATGQLWGSPLYKWGEHKRERFDWWCKRMGRALELYDETRIDHFRGFAGYWAIDGKEETAMGGSWKKGPGIELFAAMKAKLGKVPILAEDLGVITSDVVELREAIGAPGMVVLQFAWGGGPSNVHLPHMHYDNCFVYPGTHDNETAVGWFRGSANAQDKATIKAYLGSDGADIAWDFIRAGMFSAARTCIIMMQDIMRLDNSARMNTPGVAAGNWKWRIGEADIWGRLTREAADLRKLGDSSCRLPPPKPAAE